ncbi:hypothetical protein [Desulfuromonas versatilis]|uniref:hypothetical protein n=1 Tax=Desulfuromonas versatilis TaxID=2802975 RepID=UPI001C844DE6|nr:hypothetical protein [Desulfuromonas versatilis]
MAAVLNTLLLLLLPALAHAEWLAEPRVGGHFKTLNLLLEAPPADLGSSGELSSNRLRLDFAGTLPGSVKGEFSVEDILLYTDPPSLAPLPGDSPNRRLDLEKDWNRGGRFAHQLFVDRLNLRAHLAGLDWTLGRQAVGFGRISLFSPLDIIAPFPPDALDTEVRPGVDALRASRYFGMTGQAGAIAVFGQGSDDNSYLATLEGGPTGVDLLGIAGVLRERTMGGVGLATQLFGMGLKGELAWFEGRDPDRPGGDLHDDFAIAGLEADYRFDNGLILFTQYLHNGAGAGDPAAYPEALASAAVQEGLSFLLGRHYLLVAPSYQLHPLATVSGLLIWNLEDDSFLLRPLLDLSLSDNLALQLFWNLTHGAKPRQVFGLPIPRSEFGSASDSGGVFLKYFF